MTVKQWHQLREKEKLRSKKDGSVYSLVEKEPLGRWIAIEVVGDALVRSVTLSGDPEKWDRVA